MTVIEQTRPVPTPIPGVAHPTWAGSAQGLRQLSVWRQSIAAGAATPPHRHDCDEVVMCQEGWGEVHMGGEVHRFGPHNSVVLPAGQLHQIFNTGEVPMEIVGVFGQTPVACYLPDGQLLELPWAT
jgi:mannose-6-phosphate isomerase-like protein (cupin superfamily)